jgi:hypothetical protein
LLTGNASQRSTFPLASTVPRTVEIATRFSVPVVSDLFQSHGPKKRTKRSGTWFERRVSRGWRWLPLCRSPMGLAQQFNSPPLATGAVSWASLAKDVPGRSGKQCRERWHNHLNPDIVKGRCLTSRCTKQQSCPTNTQFLTFQVASGRQTRIVRLSRCTWWSVTVGPRSPR